MMKLSNNLPFGRFDWATEKAKSIIKQNFTPDTAVYYDIGAGENFLLNDIGAGTKLSQSFDLAPCDEHVNKWNLEDKFPYKYPHADVVTLLEVIEHLNNPWHSMKNISDIIKPGGFLILTTPNPGWSSSRVDLLIKGFLTCFTQSDLDNNHHVFIAWPHILKKLLNDNHLEVIEYVTIDGKTHLFNKSLKLLTAARQIPARMIKKIIEKVDPTSIGMSYGVVARKISETA